MTKIFKILLFILFLISSLTAQAQNYKYWSVGAQINMGNYYGDISPNTNLLSTDISLTRPSFGFFGERSFNKLFKIRLSYLWVRIQGDDFEANNPNDYQSKFRYIRNLNFRNDVFEMAFVGSLDLWNLIFLNSPERQSFKFHPYFFTGIAGFYHNPMGYTSPTYGSQWVALKPLGTEGQGKSGYASPYSNYGFTIPLGLGVGWHINSKFELRFEVGVRLTSSDYLDDIGGKYPNPADLSSDLARAMSNRTSELTSARTGDQRSLFYDPAQGLTGEIRGSSAGNDAYLVTGFHLAYKFNDPIPPDTTTYPPNEYDKFMAELEKLRQQANEIVTKDRLESVIQDRIYKRLYPPMFLILTEKNRGSNFVKFKPSSSFLSADAKQNLDEVVYELSLEPKRALYIDNDILPSDTSDTDRAYLYYKRIEAIKMHLIKQGLEQSRINIQTTNDPLANAIIKDAKLIDSLERIGTVIEFTKDNLLITAEVDIDDFDIYFDFNSDKIRESDKGVLRDVAATLLIEKGVRLKLTAYASADEDNPITLAGKRAQEIRSYFYEVGINPQRITFKAVGVEDYLPPAKNENDRASRRRVLIQEE